MTLDSHLPGVMWVHWAEKRKPHSNIRHENKDSWDCAQVTERKRLYQVALTRGKSDPSF